MQHQAKDLFQLQLELIDGKVKMASTDAMDKVISLIIDLKNEMNARFSEMEIAIDKRFAEIDKRFVEIDKRFVEIDKRFIAIENRLIVVETKLNIVGAKQDTLRGHFIDYAFKMGLFLFGSVFTYALTHLHFIMQ